MKQLIQNMKSGAMTIEEVPVPILTEQRILVRNQFSIISAGTEKSKIDLAKKNLLQKALARPDLVKQVWKKIKAEGLMKTYQTVNTRLEAPSPLGYSCAGIAEEVGVFVEGILPGDRVACGGAGYANHADFIVAPKNLVVKVPENVSLEEAAFTTIGAIAMQGVRLVKPLLGECFLVLGLGLIGQITSQILLANGCTVVGFDPDPIKREVAKKRGCEVIDDAEQIKFFCDFLTQGHGVDGVMICAGTTSNQPIETAADASRGKGRVVVIGAVGMNIPREPYFKKEISLIISRSYGPGRYDPHYEENGVDYPYDYVRFTEKRNMESFLQLVAKNKIQLKPLMTHHFDFQDAVKAYELLEGQTKESYLGIVLKYDNQATIVRPDFSQPTPHKTEGKINVSCIGCGNYATSTILPTLSELSNVQLYGVMSASGRTADSVAKKFGFTTSFAQMDEAFNDVTDLVMIMTRHDHHAHLAVKALQAKKHVFIEKPLAITLAQFEEVKHALMENTTSHCLIGFNRRFSPLVKRLNDFFTTNTPKIINIRVNAGQIPQDHWVQNIEMGGGRIIGEACHFVDLASAIAKSDPMSVQAFCVKDDSKPLILQDNVQISLDMANGSVANIIYTSQGASSMPKEYVEVFSEGKSAVIDDFKTIALFDAQGKKVEKLARQDKGQKAMLTQFIESLLTDTPLVPKSTLLANSLATLLIIESLSSGMKQTVV